MKHLIKSVTVAVTLAVFLFTPPVQGLAQEHPEHQEEHPEKKAKKHEHPAKQSHKVTREKLAKAIKHHVENNLNEDGYFVVKDSKTGEDLHLKLTLVHKERLATLGDGVYFACADFTSKSGDVYDLDVFMKDVGDGHLKFKKFKVHKENGQARYSWYEEDGVWKTKKAHRP